MHPGYFAPLLGAALLPILRAAMLQRGKWIPTYAGPYLIQVSRIYNCPGQDWEPLDYLMLRTSNWNPHKPAELQILSGNVSFSIDVVDEHWMKIVVDKRNNNEWKANFMAHTFPKDSCSFLRRMFPGVIKNIFGDRPDPCVLPKGNSSVQARPVSWAIPEVPVMPYGTYRLTVRTGQAGRKLPFMCLSLEGTAFPKQ